MLRTSVQVVREAGQMLRPVVRGSPCYNVQQTRTTIIVERMFPPNLGKIGMMPKMKKKQHVLKFVENTNCKPVPPISCILLKDVKGIGLKGQVVQVKRSLFRNDLYPAKKAIYASPENLAELDDQKEGEEEGPSMTAYGQLTLEQLEKFHLRVPMNGETSWILSKTNVKVALRKMGIEVQESCLTMPKEAITEPQEIKFGITINQTATVYMKGTVYNEFKDPSRTGVPDLPQVWSRKPRKYEQPES